MTVHYGLLLGVLLWCSCKNGSSSGSADKTKDTTVRISIDESFEPIMREQIKVFEVAYPHTKIVAEYKPEAECLRALQNDSTKIVIISRELNKAETGFFDEKIGYKPSFEQLATDAIAVIVNSKCRDSVFTLNELRNLLNGTSASNLTVTLDGKTATSTVRYLKDSLLNEKPYGVKVTGANNSEELIKYIASTDNAIGFVGISWLTNPQSREQEEAIQKIRIALVECTNNCEKETFAKPSQQTITFKQYPLVRGLYYVVKENYAGMGSRLVNFLCTERGQLIFKRALLVPQKIRFDRRRTQIKEQD